MMKTQLDTVSTYDRMLEYLSVNSIPGLRRIVAQERKRGSSPDHTYLTIRKAVERKYCPRGNYNNFEIDLSYLTYVYAWVDSFISLAKEASMGVKVEDTERYRKSRGNVDSDAVEKYQKEVIKAAATQAGEEASALKAPGKRGRSDTNQKLMPESLKKTRT
jgi:vacuolar-type H+-ATPase subunit H